MRTYSNGIRFSFLIHVPSVKLSHFKNIFIFLFWFALLVWHSFLSKEGGRKAVLYMSDKGYLLRVIEIKDNSLYSVAAMHEHVMLKNRVRVRANYF